MMKLGRDGAPDTGGTLKIYGEALRKEVDFHNIITVIINDDDDSSSTALSSIIIIIII